MCTTRPFGLKTIGWIPRKCWGEDLDEIEPPGIPFEERVAVDIDGSRLNGNGHPDPEHNHIEEDNCPVEEPWRGSGNPTLGFTR